MFETLYPIVLSLSKNWSRIVQIRVWTIMGNGSKLKYELKGGNVFRVILSQTFEMVASTSQSLLQLKSKGTKLVNHRPMVFERSKLVTVWIFNSNLFFSPSFKNWDVIMLIINLKWSKFLCHMQKVITQLFVQVLWKLTKTLSIL